MKFAGAKQTVILKTLKAEILAGRYAAHDAFPSEIALARRFSVSRMTTSLVVKELEREGLVTRVQGRGTFVTKFAASRKIGLIVPGVVYSEFFPPVVDELSRLSQAKGYVLLYGGVMAKDQGESVLQARRFACELVKENVAGVIYQPFEFLAGAEDRNREILEIFTRADVPVVLLGYDIAPPPQRSSYDIVGINNADAGYRIADHLLAQGARRIRFYLPRGMETSPAGHNRLRGVVTAVTNRFGKPVSRREVLLDVPLGGTKALAAQFRRSRPDAIVCCNDAVAAELRQMLGKLGLRVPSDILLAGFDDVNIARLSYPPLTSVHQPCVEIAQLAFSRLVSRLSEPGLPPVEMLLPAPVVERESSLRSNQKQKRKYDEDNPDRSGFRRTP